MKQKTIDSLRHKNDFSGADFDKLVNEAAEVLEKEGCTIVAINHVSDSVGYPTAFIIYNPKR